MDITQSQLLRVSVIDFWGTFVSPAMEENFRTDHLADDLKMTRFLAWMYVCTTVILFVIDCAFRDRPTSYLAVIFPRALTIFSTTVLLFRLYYAISPALLDRWLLGWFSWNLVMELWVHSERTASEAVLAGIFFIWALSSLVPLRFVFQAGTATVTNLGFLALIFTKKPDRASLALFVFKLILALVIGLICSRQLHRARRKSFAAHLIERETGALLEAALAEIKTLEGILPICSACKKIRREDQSWVGLDEYVSEVTTARFSHGVCPDCITRLYPTHTPRPVKS